MRANTSLPPTLHLYIGGGDWVVPPTCLASQKLQSARITSKLVRSLAKTSQLKALQKLIDDKELYRCLFGIFFFSFFFFWWAGFLFYRGCNDHNCYTLGISIYIIFCKTTKKAYYSSMIRGRWEYNTRWRWSVEKLECLTYCVILYLDCWAIINLIKFRSLIRSEILTVDLLINPHSKTSESSPTPKEALIVNLRKSLPRISKYV